MRCVITFVSFVIQQQNNHRLLALTKIFKTREKLVIYQTFEMFPFFCSAIREATVGCVVIRAPGVQIPELLFAVDSQASQTLRDSVSSPETQKI